MNMIARIKPINPPIRIPEAPQILPNAAPPDAPIAGLTSRSSELLFMFILFFILANTILAFISDITINF